MTHHRAWPPSRRQQIASDFQNAEGKTGAIEIAPRRLPAKPSRSLLDPLRDDHARERRHYVGGINPGTDGYRKKPLR
jgi:hypothetical protein